MKNKGYGLYHNYAILACKIKSDVIAANDDVKYRTY